MSSYFKIVLFLSSSILLGCRGPKLTVLPQTSAALIQLDSTFTQIDSSVWRLIKPYKTGLDSQMNVVLGSSLVDLYKKRPEGPLGNWAADAVLWQAKKIKPNAHVMCMLNHGGLRTDIAKGDITKGKIFEIMPFDNELVLIPLTPSKLIELVTLNLTKGGDPISGLTINQKCDNSLHILIGQQNLDSFSENETIWLATNDYMANGGDNYDLLNPIQNKEITGKLIRDNLIDYLLFESLNNRPIQVKIEGRITLCK